MPQSVIVIVINDNDDPAVVECHEGVVPYDAAHAFIDHIPIVPLPGIISFLQEADDVGDTTRCRTCPYS